MEWADNCGIATAIKKPLLISLQIITSAAALLLRLTALKPKVIFRCWWPSAYVNISHPSGFNVSASEAGVRRKGPNYLGDTFNGGLPK